MIIIFKKCHENNNSILRETRKLSNQNKHFIRDPNF